MVYKEKVLTGLRWSAAGKFSAQAITWGITIFVMRILDPRDYGLMAMSVIFIEYLTMLSELGLGAALIQRKDIEHQTLRKVFGIIFIINALFSITVFLSAPLVAMFFNEPKVILPVRILASQFLLISFTTIPQSLIDRDMDFKRKSIVDFVAVLAGTFCTLIMALYKCGFWSLVVGAMTSNFIRTCGFQVVRPSIFLPVFSLKGMSEILSFGSFVTLNRTLWFLFSRADDFVVGKILGKDALGLYRVAVTLASIPMEKVSGIINQVAFPAFSQIQSIPKTAGLHFLKAVRVMSLVAFPTLWGISSIAPEIVSVLLGEKWILATIPLQILSLIIPVRMISNLFSPALLGMGRADVAFRNVLLAAVIVPCCILLGSQWGLRGVSTAWVISFPVVFLFNVFRIVPILELRVADVLRNILRPLFASFGIYLAIVLCRSLMGDLLDPKCGMALLILVGFLVYTGFILLLCKDAVTELLLLARFSPRKI